MKIGQPKLSEKETQRSGLLVTLQVSKRNHIQELMIAH
jgi:hypothetical protein